MTEEQELQAKIAALSGRINLHKQQTQGSSERERCKRSQRGIHFTKTGNDVDNIGHGRGRGGASEHWIPQRGTPYGSYRASRARGRGRGYSPAHRNRTLVLNNAQQGDSSESGLSTPEPSTTPNGTNNWVSKRDRHMQLINASVYDQVSQQRNQAIAETMLQKRRLRDAKEKARLQKHFQHLQPHDGTSKVSIPSERAPSTHEIYVEGLPFRISDGGSKLIRVFEGPQAAKPTPKRATIAGVTFFRSKHGNFYRAGLVKAKKETTIKKIAEPCPRFTSTGQCPKGPNCRYIHDPQKVAICKDYLSKGSCPLGEACDLSHEHSPHNVPACLHFLRGNCTNDECRYAHIRVNPAAPVCRAFGRLGWCEKGADCAERHVFECPDYANTGVCRKSNCRLPHVDRAGQIRRATAAESSEAVDAEEPFDISSDEEQLEFSDDVDSDDLEEVFGVEDDAAGQAMTKQQDFIHL